MEKTYVERELGPLGFERVHATEKSIILRLGNLKLIFSCSCPAYLEASEPGCPIHNEGCSFSAPVDEAKRAFAPFGDMSDETLEAILDMYEKKLDSLEVGKLKYPSTNFLPHSRVKTLPQLALAHCRGILDEMKIFLAEGESKRGKLFRWLGFVQGVLWTFRLYTLKDLENHNRPAA